jgi:O-antigen/teichoic acid export membrane protein
VNRSRRLLFGIIGGALGRSVSLLAPFLIMPAMLRYLGDAHFGIWMTAVSITSMAQFSDLGIGNGLLTRLSAFLGRDDIVSARTDVSSAYAILALLALFLMVVTSALLFVSSIFSFVPALTAPGTIAIIAVVFGTFFASIPASVIQRIMYARQQVMLSNLWQIVGALFAVICCWTAIALKLAPWVAVLGYGLPAIFSLIVSALLYFIKHPELRPRLAKVSKESGRALLALGLRFLALGILTSVALNADNLIIAINAGAHSVTQYSVPAKIGSLLGLVITTLFLPLWPANGEALARGDLHWVRANTRRMVWIGVGVVATTAMALALAGNWIIHLWMGRSFENQQEILGFLGALSIAMAIASPYQMVLNSLELIRPQIFAAGTYLAISVTIKFIFVTPATLWIMPLISLSVYMLTILPISYLCATHALRRR